MNERDSRILNEIINHIQRDLDNRLNAKNGTYMQGNTIHEPYLRLSMTDYRKLCRLINVMDTLTVDMEDMPVIL